MVQMFMMPQSPKGRLAESLGAALGGLGGDQLATQLAQRGLREAMSGPAFQQSPLSEQLTQLTSAAAPYGQKGQQLAQQYAQALQMRGQETQQQRERQAASQLWNQLYPDTPPPPGMGVKDIINLAKVTNKAPSGGLSGQAVPPQVAERMEQVLKQNPSALPDDLMIAMDKAGVPRAYSNSAVESRRQTTKPIFEPESDRLEAKRVSDLATEVEKNYSTARNEDVRLERMSELSKKETLSTPSMIKALDSIGLPIGILSNPDTEEYRKLETDFIRDARDIFPGGRITNYEIQSYLKTIPTLMNSKEGREAIIRNRKLLNEAKKVKYDEYKKILKENNGRKPSNMGILLEERTADKIMDIEDKFREGIDNILDKHNQKIRMFSPDGKAYDIPAHMIPQAQQQGLMFK